MLQLLNKMGKTCSYLHCDSETTSLKAILSRVEREPTAVLILAGVKFASLLLSVLLLNLSLKSRLIGFL